jgi:hypothetical protein
MSGYLSTGPGSDEEFLAKYPKRLYIFTVPPLANEPTDNGGIFVYEPGKPHEMHMLP